MPKRLYGIYIAWVFMIPVVNYLIHNIKYYKSKFVLKIREIK